MLQDMSIKRPINFWMGYTIGKKMDQYITKLKVATSYIFIGLPFLKIEKLGHFNIHVVGVRRQNFQHIMQ